MLVTPSGIVMEVRLVQPEKALPSMLVTLSGMVMDTGLMQSRKAYGAIWITPSGMTTLPEQVVPSIRIPFTITKGSSFCFWLNQEVPLNALFSMLVTPSGIWMEVRLVQLENAQSPMLVTPSGMVMEVRLAQLENAPLPMLVTPSGILMDVRLVQP